MNITEYIPAQIRKPLYAVIAVVGVVIGAVQIGFSSAGVTDPQWLTVTLAVYPFLAGAVGFVAAGNTAQAIPAATHESSEGEPVGDFEDRDEDPDALTVEDTDPETVDAYEVEQSESQADLDAQLEADYQAKH